MQQSRAKAILNLNFILSRSDLQTLAFIAVNKEKFAGWMMWSELNQTWHGIAKYSEAEKTCKFCFLICFILFIVKPKWEDLLDLHFVTSTLS